MVNYSNVSNVGGPFWANQFSNRSSNHNTNSTILDLSLAATNSLEPPWSISHLFKKSLICAQHQHHLDISSKGKIYCRDPIYRKIIPLHTDFRPNNCRLSRELQTTSNWCPEVFSTLWVADCVRGRLELTDVFGLDGIHSTCFLLNADVTGRAKIYCVVWPPVDYCDNNQYSRTFCQETVEYEWNIELLLHRLNNTI